MLVEPAGARFRSGPGFLPEDEMYILPRAADGRINESGDHREDMKKSGKRAIPIIISSNDAERLTSSGDRRSRD